MDKRFVGDEVNIALHTGSLRVGNDDGADVGAEFLAQLSEHLIEVGMVGVHLVDEEHDRLVLLAGEFIGLFGTHRHAAAG